MTTAKNDKTLPNVAGHDVRVKTFRAWGSADNAAGAALVACFIVTAETGPTDVAEIAEARGWYGKNADGQRVPSASCAPYASTFNRAAKVANVLGIPATLELIKSAAQNADGRAREAVSDALGAALSVASAKGIKDATKAQAKSVTRAAMLQVAEKAAERKAVKVAGHKRGTKSQDSATMAAAAIASGKGHREVYAAVRLASNNAQRLPEPEGREAAWKAACKTLQDACEQLAAFK